jgi:serine/threonine-protein kinase
MVLTPGKKLGPYEILSPLGAGGMGEVYRARDTKLNRDVALKVLPQAVIKDPQRMARFEREAQVLASLNHPNIAAIYGLEESGGVRALVMELVEGPTLAERIAGTPLTRPASGGPPSPLGRGKDSQTSRLPSPLGKGAVGEGSGLPLDESLPIARQIAEALEAAHEKNITHRDLKPANVKITREGTVKVLDFGLAKLVDDAVASGDPSNSPTLTAAATQAGMIMGTAAYMAPEQARGQAVDKRADVWSFGLVLFEMLTGQQVFQGETTSDVLASVLKFDPDWDTLPASTPASIVRLLRRCLTKDRKQRLQAIGEARIVIDETLSGNVAAVSHAEPASADPAHGIGATSRRALPWALAAVAGSAAIILAVGLWRATRPVEQPMTRLRVDLGPEAVTGLNLPTAISPDGRRRVFQARGPNGRPQLATLLLDQAQPTILPGTENGSDPFFSPDGQWIGFFADGRLKKISVQGGAPVTLCTVTSNAMGASWGGDGNIIVASGVLTGLGRVPAACGSLEAITKLAPGEITHRWPQVLPGAHCVLFTASPSTTSQDDANIEAISLKTGQVKILLRGGYYGRYLPGGYLVYVRQGVLFGVGFDPERLEGRSAPTPILEEIAANAATGGGQFDFSATGTFVYMAGKSAAQAWQISWLDSSGKTKPVLAAPGTYSTLRLSPDGRKLAYVGDGSDVYIYDLERDTTSRLTFTGRSLGPVWSPDGKHLTFRTTGNDYSITWARSDGAGESQRLMESPNVLVPWSFSPDGQRLLYFEHAPQTGYDLWTLPLDITDPDHPKPGKPELFLGTPADENVPRCPPTAGGWLTAQTNPGATRSMCGRIRPGTKANGRFRLGAGCMACGRITATSCSTRLPTVASWWWITRWRAGLLCPASRASVGQAPFLRGDLEPGPGTGRQEFRGVHDAGSRGG